MVVMQNTYDQYFYVVGKGPSKTTVSVSPKVSTWGSKVLFEGTVMDISPGTQEEKIKLRFPYGVPAVSDDYQTEWMTYVYNQFPPPEKNINDNNFGFNFNNISDSCYFTNN
jgi:hypothetical protein